MRALIVFGTLLAVACARPQYSYQSSGIANYGLQAPGSSNNFLGPALGSGPVHQSADGGNKYLPPATAAPETIIRKQFYLHSAPEENDSNGKTKHFVLGRPQKNYRVVFIKAPSSSNSNVRLSAEYAPQEEKTVIYVLSKKENELDVNDIATPAPTQPSKPEVFFIKYKTPEEAAVAQREIQNQYDKLGGTSEYSDQGTAPVSSVIGALEGAASNGGYDYNQGGQRTPDESYLPPLKH